MTGQTILIIFDGADEAICDYGELVMSQGATVQWVPDAYTAMAQFASGNVPNRVLVDVRQLDEYELAFLDLAPKYYPRTQVTIPVLEGTVERLNGRSGKFETLTITELNDECLGIRAAVTAAEPDEAEVVEWAPEESIPADASVVESASDEKAPSTDDVARDSSSQDAPADSIVADQPESQDDPFAEVGIEEEAESVELDDDDLPEAYAELADDEQAAADQRDIGSANANADRPTSSRLSTDGRIDELDSGPPLHEAVRQRMAGAQATPNRRVPPGGYALGAGPTSAPAGRLSDETVTPEELDALLRTDRDSSLRGREGGA